MQDQHSGPVHVGKQLRRNGRVAFGPTDAIIRVRLYCDVKGLARRIRMTCDGPARLAQDLGCYAASNILRWRTRLFAHSLPGRDRTEWEPLTDHLMAIGNTAAKFAAIFGWADTGRAAGLLHDTGKCSDDFQAYIGAAHDVSRRGPDHSTAGARAAVQFYGKPLGRMLAYAIAYLLIPQLGVALLGDPPPP